MGSLATAQAVDDEQRQETIVVQALKQDASAQDTAATVSVVSSEDVAALNVTTISDLGGIIPGYVTMRGVAGTSSTFRGLGTNSADPSIESSVATFIDGVYYGHTRSLIAPIFDLESVEFIPGTQATLLGKNSSLGAVNMTNRRPGDVFAFNASASYVSEIEGTKLEGGVDIPLGERTSVRLAGFWNDENGALSNQFLNRDERQLEQGSLRFTLASEVGDNGELTFIYQHDERDGLGHYLELQTDPNFSARGFADSLGQSDLEVGGNYSHQSGAVGLLGEPDGPGQSDDQSGDRATLIASFDLPSGHRLTSQTSYSKWESSRVTDLDFTQFDVVNLLDDEEDELFSQELRISSDDSGAFSYLAGLFYYDNKHFLSRDTFIPSPVLGFSGLLDNGTTVDTEAWSIFASGAYELNDQWAVTGGLRYTDEQKSATYVGSFTGDIGFALGAPLSTSDVPGVDSTEVDGNIGLEYKPDSTTLFYLTFGRGSKSGGFQSTPDSVEGATFDGEVAYTTEAGAKFDLGGHAIATIALFNTVVEDFQVGRVTTDNGFPEVVIDNSEIESRGVEGSVAWDVTDEFSLNGSFVYADAGFTQDLFSEDEMGNLTVLEAYDGMPLPRSPKWSARLTGDYQKDIGQNLSLSASGSLRYTSDYDLQFRASNPLAPIADAHTLVDLQLSLGARDGGWEVALIGNNLSDEQYNIFTTDYPLDSDAYYGALNRPRTIALKLSIAR
jgi:outer membrane receptor protein involved in Fe transport